MPFKKGCEVMLRIAAPCANLCSDKALVEAAKSGDTLSRMMVKCLLEHNADSYEIISALLDKPNAEIDTMKFDDVFNEVRNSYDGVLVGFFTRLPVSETSSEQK